MSTYTIGEAAARTGFSPSTLRYYDDIALVVPAARSAAGYRLYDDDGLERLAFVARAKQLGCSLDEIADLVAVRDGDRCDPVQRRFHAIVTEKLAAARRRIDELSSFTLQLEDAATHLAALPSDGPCDDECACTTVAERASGAPVLVCTLPGADRPERYAQWRAVVERAHSRDDIDGGVRLTFGADLELDSLVRLVAAEQRCCSFFAFAMTVDERGVALEVRAPADGRPLLDALFGDD